MKKKVFAVSSLLAALAGCPKDPTPGTEITLRLFPESGLGGGQIKVAFVAYQDGNGAWQRMPGSDGTYRAVVLDDRYGIAVGCQPQSYGPELSGYNTLNIQHLTVDEQTELRDLSCYDLPLGESTITGTATGLAAGEEGVIQTGLFASATVAADGTFSITAENGTHPLFAFTRVPPAPIRTPARVVRGPDGVFPSSTPIAIDFSQAVAPSAFPVTWPAGVEFGYIASAVRRGGSNSITARINGTATEYKTVPASMLQTGEVIRVSAAAASPDFVSSRLSLLYLSTPGPITVELAQPVAFVDATVPSAGRRLASFGLPALSSSFPFVDQRFSASTYTDTSSVTHYVTMSRGWVGSQAISYTIPDLSAIPGYVSSLDLAPDGEVSWDLARDEISTREFIGGRKVLSYTKNGVITP